MGLGAIGGLLVFAAFLGVSAQLMQSDSARTPRARFDGAIFGALFWAPVVVARLRFVKQSESAGRSAV